MDHLDAAQRMQKERGRVFVSSRLEVPVVHVEYLDTVQLELYDGKVLAG